MPLDPDNIGLHPLKMQQDYDTANVLIIYLEASPFANSTTAHSGNAVGKQMWQWPILGFANDHSRRKLYYHQYPQLYWLIQANLCQRLHQM